MTKQKNKTQKLASNDFVHLHNHTEFSLLDGMTKVPALVESVVSMGMEAVAITDHGTLSGAVDLYENAKSKNIKPIIGIETYVASRKLTDKDPQKDKQYHHLILLAMNNQGYKNLMKLATVAQLEGFYYKPRIDRETLKKYSDGIIALSGCISSELGDALRQEQPTQAEEVAKWYKDVFGDRYYIEIQDHGHPNHPSVWQEQTKVNKQSFKIAKKLGVKTVITGDAHYLEKSDQQAHEILLCVQTGSFLSDKERMSLAEFELHVADPEDIIKRWGVQNADSIKNTKEIADRCNVEIKLDNYLIPKFNVPKGETENSYLERLTYKGLGERYVRGKTNRNTPEIKKQLKKEIVERAEYELSIINRMGFAGYFLIVSDFVNWGKEQDIVFGPGRGSGASSIVAYGLRITEIDPLEYDLLFERFLNPDRISMPDFDIDIQDTRRDEVIEYCVNKYGEEKVANIVTFGRMAARNAVRDVARVLEVPYADADRLAKMIPPPIQGRHILLEKSLKDNSDLALEYKENSQSREVFDLAIKLEGTMRSHGVHAAGVVIAPENIVNFTPLEKAQKGVISTQYSMGPIDKIGLLKVDFLGLSNLTIINNSTRIIKKVYGKDVDIAKIPLDDEKTFKLLQKGDTTGVFQLESAGMKRYLKELKPTIFEDIIAMVALYRPGPMAQFPKFIEGKNNPSSIKYPHELLEPVLNSTYGVIVFQEQIIALLQLLAGYKPGEADLIRKAIGKKNRNIMNEEKPRFIKGCKEQGLSEKEAIKIWDLIQPFADYSFNKAHAACYGLIAYQTAYLKANYPAAFMAALMSSDYDDSDRLSIEISECRAMGIDVLPPDINQSFGEFAVMHSKDSESIRFGMHAVKNVGSGAVAEIVRARDESGPFKTVEDFLQKTSISIVNKKALESLVKSGAFDDLEDRHTLFENLEIMLAFASRHQKQSINGQTDLFGEIVDDPGLKVTLSFRPTETELPPSQMLQWERELLGIYLSSHPLSEYGDILKLKATSIKSLENVPDNKHIKIGGSITEKREITTKSGQKMAFVKIADMESEVELIVFPGMLAKTEDIWQRDNVLLIGGKVTKTDKNGNNSEVKIIVETAEELDTTNTKSKSAISTKVEASVPKRVYVRLPNTKDEKKLSRLKQLVDGHTGDTEVVLVVGPNDDRQIIKIPSRVSPSQDLLAELSLVFGADTIKHQ